jgi:transcriptional regulator with XRE-family HTH domain
MKPPIENIELIREAKKLSRETVADKLGINVSNYGKVERGEVGLTMDRLYELADIFRMQPEEILTYNKPSKGNITYIPADVQAIFLAGQLQEDISEYKTFSIPIVQTKQGFMINAKGDSMFPLIIHGDHIMVEPIKDINKIKFGSIYVVVTKDGECIIKRVHNHPSKKKFILKSDNAVYEPFDMDRKDILSIWLVKDYKLTNLTSLNRYLLSESKK